MAKNNWTIRQLTLRRRRLEDHFFEVMRQSDPLQRARLGLQASPELQPATERV